MKRRLIMLCMLIVLVIGLAVPAAADNSAPKVEMYITVNPDGDALVSMNVTFHLDAADQALTFPLPRKAGNITMNGGSVGTSVSGDVILANVGASVGEMTGDFSARFDYSVPEAVKAVKINQIPRLQLDLDLLCGFKYPVGSLNFVITLPANITTIPTFSSTYQQISFESNLDLITRDNMITGQTKQGLRDHEAVTLSMLVPQEMFPTVSTYQREGNPELYPMAGLAVLALLYWLIFLFTLPPIRTRSTNPPAGISAGEIGCRLSMVGGDLTMMVLTWAQLGYLLIHLEGSGRVLLHKRMDMGNERSLFEVRVFQALFGNRRVVDCSGSHYATVCARTSTMIPGEKTMTKPGSGNRKVVRVLLCIAQVFCGICVAMNMTGILVLEIIFSITFGIFAIFSAWQMQSMAFCLHVRHKTSAWIGFVSALIWVVLGVIAHQPWIPLGACVVQMLFGFLIAYGCKRTDLNRLECGEILGLKHYLRQMPRPEAARLQKVDPEFFFRMAPFAIAMGVGKPFAAAFSKKKLDQCPYFVTRIHGKRTASEWMQLMLQAVSAMDYRFRRNKLEKWLAIRFR